MNGMENYEIAEIERRRQRAVFEQYEAHPELFTANEWIAICLCFRDGLTQGQAAALLDLSRKGLSNRVSRARRKLEKNRREARAEVYRLVRHAGDS